MKDYKNFVKNVPRVPKCIRGGVRPPNHFLMSSKMKSCTMHVQLGDPKTVGSDVPKFVKDVPTFQSAFRGGDRPSITSLWVPK